MTFIYLRGLLNFHKVCDLLNHSLKKKTSAAGVEWGRANVAQV